MKKFIDVINWVRFGKFMAGVTFFLILASSGPVKWGIIALIDFLIALVLLLKAYSEYMIRPKPKPTLRELRKLKLKRINRF